MIFINTLKKEEVRKFHSFEIFLGKILRLAVVTTQKERK